LQLFLPLPHAESMSTAAPRKIPIVEICLIFIFLQISFRKRAESFITSRYIAAIVPAFGRNTEDE
jgi:hypothetical protein